MVVVGKDELLTGGGDGLTMVRVVVVMELLVTADEVVLKLIDPVVPICSGTDTVVMGVAGELIVELGRGDAVEEVCVVGIDTMLESTALVDGDELLYECAEEDVTGTEVEVEERLEVVYTMLGELVDIR